VTNETRHTLGLHYGAVSGSRWPTYGFQWPDKNNI